MAESMTLASGLRRILTTDDDKLTERERKVRESLETYARAAATISGAVHGVTPSAGYVRAASDTFLLGFLEGLRSVDAALAELKAETEKAA